MKRASANSNNLSILRILLIPVLAAFTFSACSDDGGDAGSGGGGSFTETYAITKINEADGTFEYTETYEDYECKEGGVLEKEIDTDNETSAYEIKDGVLAFWLDEYDRRHEEYYDDSLHFKGSSNTITGTWTRSKNKAASCRKKTETWCSEYDYDTWECLQEEEESYTHCKYGYDIVKMEISQSAFKITHDFCLTDRITIGESWTRGWTFSKIYDCNSYEISNGTDKVMIKLIGMHGGQATYNGKTCKDEEPSVPKREKACRDAWNKIQAQGGSTSRWELEDAYYEFLENDFYECTVRNNFPPGLFGDYDDYGEPVGLMKKSGGKPALKKKNLFGLPRK